MRGLLAAGILLFSTALVGAQRPASPPSRSGSHPPPSHQPAPRPTPRPPAASSSTFVPSGPPLVFPFQPAMLPPAGGFTSGFSYPPRVNPAYSPRRHGYPYGGYAYSGGYFYAPDAASQPSSPSAQEPTGLLRLSGTPSVAQVFVDGYYVTTMADAEAQRALELPAGPHRIELRAPDYVPTTFDVRISPNDTITYRAALELNRPQPARTPTPAAGPTKMYLIPNCYLGNVPPKADRLPRGCDVKRVQTIS